MTNEEPMGQQQQQVTFQDGTASATPQDANTLVTPTAGAGASSTSTSTTSKQLSVVSKAYDRDNKGYLDQTEQRMREMDASGRGHVPNGVVYDLMQESGAFLTFLNKLNASRHSCYLCVLFCAHVRSYRRKRKK